MSLSARVAPPAFVGALWAIFLLGCRPSVPLSELSVVLVTLDTTRADRIGSFGGTAVPTPNLDRVARDGVVFEETVAQAPLTLPSHATLFTGRYPASHGVRHNGFHRLPEAETTLAERLRGAGFETAAFVGAFVVNRGFGLEQGFDVYDDVSLNRFRGGADQILAVERSADEVNARVFHWLDRRKAGPFFLWVHYYDPHHPYKPPEKPTRSLSGEGYDREISYVDACFGDLLDRLREKGLLDRALLVVSGDHGESLGEHDEKTHGVFLYEAVLRVPLLMRAPGLLPAGRRVPGPVELTDVAPTILDLLRMSPLERAQGRSLRARIAEEEDGRGILAHAETLLPRLDYGWSELRTVRDGRFKFIEAPRPELYDLRRDPREEVNLASAEPERVQEMAALTADWARATDEGAAEGAAARTLTAEEEAMLRSLGYLGGDAFRGPRTGARLDPKDGIELLARVEEARERWSRGDAEGALREIEGVLEGDPQNPAAMQLRAMTLADLDRLREAEAQALATLTAVREDPGARRVVTPRARGILAICYRRQGRIAKAEAEYRSILAEDPWDVTTVVELARLLRETGRPDEARRLAEDLLARDGSNAFALGIRLELELDAGDREAALRTASAIADARAGYVAALTRAAGLLLEAGDPKRAAACLETALGAHRKLPPDLVRDLGHAQLAAGDLDAARLSFQALSRLRPMKPAPHYQLAVIAARKGDLEGAREELLLALRLDPSFEPARHALREIEGLRLGTPQSGS